MPHCLRALIQILPLLLLLAAAGCQKDTDRQPGDPQQQSADSPAASADAPSATGDRAREPAERTATEGATSDKGQSGGLGKFAGRAAREGDTRPEAVWPPDTTGEYPIGAYNNYIETGDLDAIKKRGKLRILVNVANTDSLHRAATPQDRQIERAKRMAEFLELEPVVLYVDRYDQLIPLLIEGKGDLIANHMAITDEQLQQIGFSIPVGKSRYLLLSRKDTPDIKEGDSLRGKTVHVTRGSHFEKIAKEKAAEFPGVKIKAVDANDVALAEQVSQGKIDFTITTESAYGMISQYRDNLKANVMGDVDRPMAWGLRKDAADLKEALDRAVRHFQLTKPDDRSIGDLDEIRKRGLLRAVTRNHPGTYFMWKGRVMGYEYELLQKFAKELGVRLEIVVAPTHKEVFTMIRDGKADIAASLISATTTRDEAGMDFGPPYMQEEVSIVGRKHDKIENLQDLDGRTIHLLRSSSQYEVLMKLLQKHEDIDVEVELVPEELTIPQVLDRVAEGDYDLTIADDVTVRLEHHWRDDIVNLYNLTIEDNVYAWMVRDSNQKLLQAINKFFNDPENIKFRESLFIKYFEEPKRTRDEIETLSEKGEISPYDKLVKKYAEEYDFDWRLVVAQMFQESSFNPKAKSWVGARGLMQVMPDTGKQVGESKNLFDPETSVRAGFKYLEWLHRKFEDKGISPENMMWFTLASYNAGLGHVYDAQDLAEEKGWDRNVWFGNVENAMLLLSEKKYYSKARYGYARGREPYEYVRKISQRFRTYAALLEAYQRQQEVGQITCPGLPSWLREHLTSCQPAATQAFAL
ncbi:membrane-bound lytic murein transglycosylase F [Microbulbifer aestuariivivens]|uniref:Membrane-bound lytic murein transglycosylase F n=1 Tax=Microbulbifer aestuariivivens TaxID=1908308 RepID=A0ABP9WNI5_9GAMM